MSNARDIADSNLDGLTVDTTTLVVDSTNNRVGIGTSSPDASLEIKNTSATLSSPHLKFEGSGGADDDFAIYAPAGENTLRFGYDHTSLSQDNILVLNSSGNVGVGTSSALDLLHLKEANGTATSTQLLLHNNNTGSGSAGVAFSVMADGETTSYAPKGAILFERTATNGRGAFKFMADNFDDTNPFSAADEVMRITPDGKVGIGTSSPVSPLEIATTNKLGSTFTGTTNGEGLTVTQTNYTAGNYVSLVEAAFDDSGDVNPNVRIGAMFDGSGSNLAFGTSNSYGSGITNTAMFINSSGRVGIGTSSPDSGTPLHVAESSASLGANPTASAFLVERAGNVGMTLGTANTGTCSIFMGDSDSLTVGRVQYDNSDNSLGFWANSLERMRILADGRVGTATHLFTGRVDGVSYTSGEHQVGCFGGGASEFTIAKGCSVADTDIALWIAAGGSSRIKLQADGNGRFDGSADIGSADYAEMFEWDDGNTSDEDRVGYSVVLTNGNKIRKATSSDAAGDIIGIISGRPGVVGDNNHFGWQGKWQTDDFMRRTMQDITVYSWTDENGEDHQYRHDRLPDGVTVPDDAESVVRQEAVVSSNYDDTLEYAPREDRQEWDAVGMMGKVRLRVGQPTGDRWIKMKDIATDDDGNVTVEEWLVR